VAKHLSERKRVARWVEVGAVVVLLVLAGGASVAGPQLFGPAPEQEVSDPGPPISPEASPSSEEPSVTPAPVVPPQTLSPAPEPKPEPKPAKPPKKKIKKLRAAAEAELTPPVTFRMASFNVLGSSHSSGGGNKPGFAEGPVRMGWTVDLLRASGVSVVGFQEYEPNQHHTFVRRTGGSWGVFPGMSMGTRGVRNSVAWSSATWELVEAHTSTIPYFRGNPVPMPYVLLEHRETGQRAWFISIHNPTSNPKRGNNQRWRNIATQRERALMSDLASSGTPVFLTGDFNERNEAFCQITAGGVAQAAQGGSGGPPCRPPAAMGIDWIFGTPDVTFSGYVRRQDAAVRRASDHPLILTTAFLPGE
jgi:endonuclease/exonuclease/phosphatase family metal-dependent hydrolase